MDPCHSSWWDHRNRLYSSSQFGKNTVLKPHFKSDSVTKWQVCSSVKKNWCNCVAPEGINQGVGCLLWALSNKGEHCNSSATLSGRQLCMCKHPMSEKMCSDGWPRQKVEIFNYMTLKSGKQERFPTSRGCSLLFSAPLERNTRMFPTIWFSYQHISINTQWRRTWTERQSLTDIMRSLLFAAERVELQKNTMSVTTVIKINNNNTVRQ